MRDERTALTLDALAVYRLTRLVTLDDITAPLRDRALSAIYRRSRDEVNPAPTDWTSYAIEDENPPKLATLLTCRWCTGTWCAMMVVWLRRRAPKTWDPLSVVLTLSAGAALIARLED